MGSRNRFWHRVVLILAGLMLASVLVSGLALMAYFRPERYMEHASPDGRYSLVVYRTPILFSSPGQAGDAPGRVVLVDNRGEELNSMDVDMVQMATQPQWSQDRVTIRLLLDWKLE